MRKNNLPASGGCYTKEIYELVEKRKHDSRMVFLQVKGKRQSLSIALRKARLKKGISQTALAFDMGVNQNYISRVESGKINITIDMLLKMTYYLDCFLSIYNQNQVKQN